MGRFYGLSAEFGKDKESCEKFISFFNNQNIKTEKGEYTLNNYLQSYDSNFWSWIVPQNLPSKGILSKDDALIMTLVGGELLRLVKSIPVFRYCILGIDSDVYITEKELFEAPDFINELHGFVIEDDLYSELGRPGTFTEFIPGFVWKEYKGEKYHV